ncbi:MAG TPA: hypothetical protein VNC40_04325 [Gaiellaceae bacterium]|nr:hypothetical protein [Gaiellaceae bacterium]
MNKRTALTLAGVLAATVLTGGAAILGISHTAAVAQPAPAAVVQAQQPPAPTQTWEGGD